MKKVSILILMLISISAVGCTDNKNKQVEEFLGDDSEYASLVIKPKTVVQEKDDSNKSTFYNENFIELEDSSKIFAMYDGLDENKYRLTYDYIDNGNYYYEYENGIAISSVLNDIPSVTNKKYQEILRSFTFPVEGMDVKITYKEAMGLVQKVLPDDIKKESEKIKKESSDLFIYYSSSKGKFLVVLSRGMDDSYIEDTSYKDDDIIYGIEYLKEV